jgi:hypothetical protein
MDILSFILLIKYSRQYKEIVVRMMDLKIRRLNMFSKMIYYCLFIMYRIVNRKNRRLGSIIRRPK